MRNQDVVLWPPWKTLRVFQLSLFSASHLARTLGLIVSLKISLTQGCHSQLLHFWVRH